MAKTNGKRKSPSVERQLALALVAVLEASNDETEMDIAATDARAILKTHGYDDLESIPTRVKRIEAEIETALKAQDGARLAQLGAMLDRAKSGKPPLTTEKKPRAPRKPKTEKPPSEAEKKGRKKKDEGVDPQVEPAQTLDGEPGWLTSHPEPKE